MQIDCSAAFDRVNHREFFISSVLLVIDHSIMIDCCGVNWLMLCRECCREVFWHFLFFPYTSELVSIQENKLIGHADDSTLSSVVPFPGVRATVAESLNRVTSIRLVSDVTIGG